MLQNNVIYNIVYTIMNMVLYYNLMQYTLMHCTITIQNRIHNKYNIIQCVKYTLGISHLIRLCVVSESAYMLMTHVIKQIMKKWGAKFVKFQFNPLFFFLELLLAQGGQYPTTHSFAPACNCARLNIGGPFIHNK